MYRHIFIPTERAHTIDLPPNLYGKRVEVIAFAISEEELTATQQAAEPEVFYSRMQIDLSKYKFDRDEANER